MNTVDVSWWQLSLGYGLLLIPLLVFLFFRVGLAKTAIFSAMRMTVQLLLVGLYLEWIFHIDSPWINLSWLGIMLGVAAFTVTGRAELYRKPFLPAVLAGFLLGLALSLGFLLLLVLELPKPWTARYLIPLSGMILGNCLNTSVVGMRSWQQSITRDQELYCYYLACGASGREALLPFIRNALRDAFQPSLATMATIGLIALPGMMTGQILGGASPVLAIKYQILIMLSILSATVTSVVTGILISRHTAFDDYGMPLDPSRKPNR